MTPRQLIDRKAFLLRMELGKARERGESEAAFEERIAFEIERLARRIIDHCDEMRGQPARQWIEPAPHTRQPRPAVQTRRYP